MLTQLLICAVLFIFGWSVALWGRAPIDRKEVHMPPSRRDSHTP